MITQNIFDAVIFDLDGVITDSTPLHSRAWKEMFDEYLREWAEQNDAPFREFTHQEDYLAYVDGKPRYKGVESFLQSRGIHLPYGDPADGPHKETICGLGNQKNEIYNQLLEQEGVDIYATTVELVHQLRSEDIPLGVASSSKNARKVLEITGLIDLFQTCVDGTVSAELDLQGKPMPDIFTTACDNLGAAYDRSVIVEDAISGVQAGYRGNFGLVIGVAREDNKLDLKLNGADIVVEDMLEIDLQRIRNWFLGEIERKQWSITYTGYDPEHEGSRETLCTVGNGYFGTRGALEEIPANGDINYPGTYIAGLYNRLESTIAGRTITNEDFVNCPNWLPITFKIEGGEWFDPTQTEMLEFERELDFKTGVLSRTLIVRDKGGNQTRITSRRFASMADPHLAGLRYQITPLNYAKKLTVRSGLEGNLINYGVKRYRELSSRHLQPVEQWGDANTSALLVETNQSNIKVAQAAKLSVRSGQETKPIQFSVNTNPGSVTTTFETTARSDQPLTVEKTVAIYSSNITEEDVYRAAIDRVKAAPGYGETEEDSIQAWEEIWDRIDIRIKGDRLVQKMIRLHLYHSLVTASPHHIHLDAGIPARGLHGEAYRGHIFWDELYILPFYDLYFPETARSVLMYRCRRLDAAREYARQEGYSGAIFPWQSGLEGREETQHLHLNPINGKWGPDFSHLQRHVSLAVAYNIWQYLWITDDLDFINRCGAEIFLEICRYWGDKATYDPERERYDIKGVMGPDEFHEKYPGAEEGGLRNNAYTNIMVVWAMNRAFDLLEMMPPHARKRVSEEIALTDKELERWKDISRRLTVPVSEEGIIEQFEGYFDLKELDWEFYQSEYGDIHRMDRILKAEGKSPNAYKVAKQADALMACYLLSGDEVNSILEQLGYDPPPDLLAKNFHYYLQRTSHGSTLSRLVHAFLANLVGEQELSWKLYLDAVRSDFMDIQGGTTKEGIHMGVMTGTALFVLSAYAGLNWIGEHLSLEPRLPSGWNEIRFKLFFRDDAYSFKITSDLMRVKVINDDSKPIIIHGEEYSLETGEWHEIKL